MKHFHFNYGKSKPNRQYRIFLHMSGILLHRLSI